MNYDMYMKKIDLHTHSRYSDGTLTPSELVRLAAETGVAAVALTDHDTAAGVSEAEKAGKRFGVEIVPGTELAAEYNNEEIHILGYFVDYNGQYFIKALEKLAEIRRDRNERLSKRLKALNMPLTDDTLAAGGITVTRLHFAKAMVKRGYVKTVAEAFSRYLDTGRPAFVGRNAPGCGECAEMLKLSGGIPVLAHPYSYKWAGGGVIRLLEAAKEAGIEGVEAIYPYHAKEQTRALIKAAERLGMLVTGGSDFHGENRPEIEIGTGKDNIRVGYEILEELKKAHGKITVI